MRPFRIRVMAFEIQGSDLESLSRFIETRLGLSFPPERRIELERGLRKAAAALRFEDSVSFSRSLVAGRLTKEQLQVLASHLTVGETYFFRDSRAFRALEQAVLPELIRARRGAGRCLRIWSAGCCSGEEPYSLAIVLDRLLPDIAQWNLTILATDVNPDYLAKAALGVYSQWSFRGLPESFKTRYFVEIASGRFRIVERLRKLVTFAPLNLAEDTYPSIAGNTNAMDVILCRNVLMYFTRNAARRVISQLGGSLVEGGCLFASVTDASPELFSEFVTEHCLETVVYRKDREQPNAPEEPRAQPAAVPVPPARPAAIPEKPSYAGARRLANQGRLSEALAECESLLAADTLSAQIHYLRGVILEELGDFDEATRALKRALFLEGNFILAHFALAHLLKRRSQEREADRSFENARALLRKLDPAEAVPEAEGLTAGRLLEALSVARAEAVPQ